MAGRAAAALEGWAWQGRRRERDAKKLEQQARWRRDVGGSSGATSTSFKSATGDDAATRSSPAEPEEGRSRATRRGLEGGETSEVGGKPGEASACETPGAARGLVSPARLQVGACALPRRRARPPPRGPGPAQPGRRWVRSLLVLRLSILKDFPPVFGNGGSIQAALFVNVASSRAERVLPPPLKSTCLLMNENG